MKTLRIVVWIALGLLSGRAVTRYVLSIEAPSPRLDAALEWLIARFSIQASQNPDVVFTTGALLTMLCASLVSMAVIYLLWWVGGRRSRIRSAP